MNILDHIQKAQEIKDQEKAKQEKSQKEFEERCKKEKEDYSRFEEKVRKALEPLHGKLGFTIIPTSGIWGEVSIIWKVSERGDVPVGTVCIQKETHSVRYSDDTPEVDVTDTHLRFKKILNIEYPSLAESKVTIGYEPSEDKAIEEFIPQIAVILSNHISSKG